MSDLEFNAKNFINDLIFHPEHGKSKSDQDKALATTIFIGLITLGIAHACVGLYHLGNYIWHQCIKQKEQESLKSVDLKAQTIAQDQGLIQQDQDDESKGITPPQEQKPTQITQEEEEKPLQDQKLTPSSSQPPSPPPEINLKPKETPPIKTEKEREASTQNQKPSSSPSQPLSPDLKPKETPPPTKTEKEEEPGRESLFDFNKRKILSSMQEIIEQNTRKTAYFLDSDIETYIQNLSQEATNKGISAEKIFNAQEKYLLAKACYLYQSSLPEDTKSPSILDKWINETILPCETSRDVKNSILVLTNNREKTISSSVVKHWIAINKAKITQLIESDVHLLPLLINHLDDNITAKFQAIQELIQEGHVSIAISLIKNNKELTQEERFKLAKLCAQQDAGATVDEWEIFQLSNPQVLEVLTLCVQEDPTTINVISDVPKEIHFDLIKIHAQQKNGELNHLLGEISLEEFSPEQRFELAKLYAQTNSLKSQHIKDFQLDENEIFEIAKICTFHHPQSIDNFSQLTPAQFFEVVKFSIQKNVSKILSDRKILKKFTPDQIFELSKIAAQNDVKATLKNLNRLSTLTPEHWLELAKLCAVQNGEMTADSISKFDELSKSQKFDVLMLCAKHDGFGTLLRINKKDLGKDRFKTLLKECINSRTPKQPKSFSKLSHNEMDRFISRALKKIPNCSPQLTQFQDKTLHFNEKAWLLTAIHNEFILSDPEKEWDHQRDLLTHLFRLSPPSLREKLTYSLEKTKETRQLIDKIVPIDSPLAKEFPLIVLPLAQLCEIGLSEDRLTQTVKNLTLCLNHPNSQLKNASIQALLLKHLHLLTTSEHLSNEQKISLFKKMIDGATQKDDALFFEKTLRMNLIAFSGMISFGDIQQVKQELESSISLRKQFEESFQRHIPIKKIENFLDRYEETFGISRDPDAIIDYAKTIKKLKNRDGTQDKKAVRQLCSYIESVVKKTFFDQRYAIDEFYNPHFFELFNEKEDSLKAWRTLYQFPIEELTGTSADTKSGMTAAVTDDPIEILLAFKEAHSTDWGDHVNEDAWNGEALLGPLLNGKYLLTCIKDAHGKIIAESMLSLLISEGKPVLLKLWTLPGMGNVPEQHQKAIEALVEKKAKDLGCQIVTLELDERGGEFFRPRLLSLKGPSYEWNPNAVGGASSVKNRPYEVSRTKIWSTTIKQ